MLGPRLIPPFWPLCLVVLLLASPSLAATIGNFCSITDVDFSLPRGYFGVSIRPVPNSGDGTAASPRLETWFAFVTPSTAVGCESTGEIWLGRNQCSAFEAPRPILRDGTSNCVSYIDPAWSPDGRWLAYVRTDNNVTSSGIYVQQYEISTDGATAVTPLGQPVLIAEGGLEVHHRDPAWSTDGTQIAYDSDATGLSVDLWTVNVALDGSTHTGVVDETSRVRRTTNDGKAEFKPAYSPEGTRLAFVSNQLGTFSIWILDLISGMTTKADSSFTTGSQVDPRWSSDGRSIYYSAPPVTDPFGSSVIWRLDLSNQTKTATTFEGSDVDASRWSNVTASGKMFNYIAFTSGARAFRPNIWRGFLLPPNRSPVANAGGPYHGVVGVPVALDGSLSSDPDGDPLQYSWSFGDGGTAHDVAPFHAYAQNGVFTVALEVADGIASDRDTTSCDILAVLPARAFSYHKRIMVGEGPPSQCIQVEPVEADYANAEVDLSSLTLASDGSGATVRISAVPSKSVIEADRDRNGILEIPACFSLEDLSRLFGDVRGRRTFHAALEGRLLTGAFIQAPLDLEVQGPDAENAALLAPNPIRPGGTLSFRVTAQGPVVVRLFDLNGRLVRTMTQASIAAGFHQLRIQSEDDRGKPLASGIYFYNIQMRDRALRGRFAIVR